jgi:hypothetical protein
MRRAHRNAAWTLAAVVALATPAVSQQVQNPAAPAQVQNPAAPAQVQNPAAPALAGRSLDPPGGTLLAPGNAPDLLFLYTGDVIGYLEPCG